MFRYLMISATLFIASCGDQLVVTRWVVPEVPSDLRTPVSVADRDVETLSDVGLVLTDHVEALDAANGKIVATDAILIDAECRAGVAEPAKCGSAD